MKTYTMVRTIVAITGAMIVLAILPLTASAAGSTGYVTKKFDTSWHHSIATLTNCAKMPNSHTVNGCASFTHNDNNIDFYWTRIDMQVINASTGTVRKSSNCKVNGDIGAGYYRGCLISYDGAYGGSRGWIVKSRICADIKDDGNGERCSGWAQAITAY